MKNFLLALMLLGFLCPKMTNAQTKAINTFYKKHKKVEGANHMSIPAFAIDIAASIVKMSAETEQERQGIRLLKKVNKVKLLTFENGDPYMSQEFKQLKSNLKKESFDEMLSMRDGGTRLEFMVRPRKGKLKNIILYIKDGTEVSMISLKTKIKLKDIQRLLNLLESEYDLQLDLPQEIREDKNPTELLKA